MTEQTKPTETATTEKQIATTEQSFPVLAEYGMTMPEMVKMLVQSELFKGKVTPYDATAKILIAHDLGMSPVESMMNIYIAKGNIGISSNARGAAIKQSGKYDFRVRQSDDKICTIEFLKLPDNEVLGTSTFTIEQATKAGLAGKDNWRYFTEDMLYARALSRGQRKHCPDVFKIAIYDKDELQEIKQTNNKSKIDDLTARIESGDVVEGEYTQPDWNKYEGENE